MGLRSMKGFSKKTWFWSGVLCFAAWVLETVWSAVNAYYGALREEPRVWHAVDVVSFSLIANLCINPLLWLSILCFHCYGPQNATLKRTLRRYLVWALAVVVFSIVALGGSFVIMKLTGVK